MTVCLRTNDKTKIPRTPMSILIFVLWFLSVTTAAEDTRRPNVIIFQPDDFQSFEEWHPPAHFPFRAEVNHLSDINAGLPFVEKLRQQGLTLARAYTASPACGTSRYSTLTGRYPSRSSYGRATAWNSDNNNNNDNTIDLPSNVVIPYVKVSDQTSVVDGADCSSGTVAGVLAQHGYRTGMVGKWHLTRVRRNSYSYASLQQEVQACGFDYVEALYGENLNSNIFTSTTTNDDNNNPTTFSHNMEYVTGKGIDFIDAAVAASEPFFLYFNPTVPHGSGDVSDAIASFDCRQTPEGWLDAEPDVPYMTQGQGCRAYRDSLQTRASSSDDDWALGSLWVDDALGALMKRLDELGQLDNTLIVFQQDHGQEGKMSLYEPGIRISSFVHYPNALAAGSVFDGLTSTIDLGPTILEAAGIAQSDAYAMDGRSWLQAASSNAQADWTDRCIFAELQSDRAVVCECDKYVTVGDTDNSDTFRKGSRWGVALDTEMLFDLCDDSGVYQAAPDGSSPEVLNRLSTVEDNGEVLSVLQDLLDCHLSRTRPSITPDYETTCARPGSALYGPNDDSSSPAGGGGSTVQSPSMSPSTTSPPVVSDQVSSDPVSSDPVSSDNDPPPTASDATSLAATCWLAAALACSMFHGIL